jgi:hypothetical protein
VLSRPSALAKTVMLLGWLATCLMIYRFILFFTLFTPFYAT